MSTRQRADGCFNPYRKGEVVPISRIARANKVKKLIVELGDDETCAIWYRVSVLTPAFMTRMDEINSNAEKTKEMVVRLVDKWDVYDEVDENGQGIGERVPVTDEAAAAFDFKFHNAIITAVMADINPDPTPAVSTGSFS